MSLTMSPAFLRRRDPSKQPPAQPGGIDHLLRQGTHRSSHGTRPGASPRSASPSAPRPGFGALLTPPPAKPARTSLLSGVMNRSRRSPESDLPPIADGQQQSTSQAAAKLATAVLMGCLILAPVGAGAGILALTIIPGSSPKAAATTTAPTTSNEQAQAAEFAQRVVLTWLGATVGRTNDLRALMAGSETDVLITSREAYTAVDPAVAGMIPVAKNAWSVTIAVTVSDSRPNTLNPQSRRYFRVPVQVGTEGQVAALTLPAPVSAPAITAVDPSSEYDLSLSTTGTAGQTVTEFLAAYLTGAGDIARYLTPGVALTAVNPAPYASVELESLRASTTSAASAGDSAPAGDSAGGTSSEPDIDAPGDGDRMRVLAVATASVTQTQSSAVTYALTLTARAGRWEVTAIDTTPLLPGDAAAARAQESAQAEASTAAEELRQTGMP